MKAAKGSGRTVLVQSWHATSRGDCGSCMESRCRGAVTGSESETWLPTVYYPCGIQHAVVPSRSDDVEMLRVSCSFYYAVALHVVSGLDLKSGAIQQEMEKKGVRGGEDCGKTV